ncbi:glycosyltransferase family 39 protein [uncultured Bacteroides sp.]|uniref:ArnT family glycosyltransferase n=1 Tax=uncultured Bacteroides sp. TaxID=162156 RepID=UPI002AAC39D4|nr:glycosyltransferase family 39 protein [uncultured Bacteroides sp.]
MVDSINYVKHSLILLLVCFFSFFVNNSFIPADLMESRNLATAQEMVIEGNYLTPTMNGELRLEKPPLPTWIAAGINHIAPDNLSAQRYAAGAAATLMVFFLYLLVVEFTRNQKLALISAVVLATCYNVIMMGRTATWDIYCYCFMLGALYYLIKALARRGPQWGLFFLSGLFMGLSFLSGFVSFVALMLPFLIAYFIIYRLSLKDKIPPIIMMVIICLVISLWWPVYIYFNDVGMHVANKESSSWLNHNVRPWYYYWKFPAEAGIWALFWVTSLVWPYWKLRLSDLSVRRVYLFSLLWTFLALVLLSLIPEKKTRYLLPLLIPGALNIGTLLFYFITNRLVHAKEKMVFRINAFVILLILIAMPAGLYYFFVQKEILSVWLFVVISLIDIVLAVLLYMSTFRAKANFALSFSVIVGVMVLVEALCFIPASEFFINNQRHSIREVRTVSQVQHFPFYYIPDEGLRIELVYESNKIIRPLDVNNDSLVLSSLPFVLVSASEPDSLFSHLNVNIEHVDIYDNNWQKKTSKRYNKALVRYVSVIKRE